jgi:UDP-N-acetylmuramyl pentapeptide synthase
VLNADSPGFEAWCERALCRVVSWGRERGDHRWSWQPGDAEAAGWLSLDGRRWPVPLPGAHNGANLCAAILAARAVGQEDAQLAAGLGAFRASAHRGDLRRLGGRLVLDDSYNANPESVCTAVRALLDLPGGEALAEGFREGGGEARVVPDHATAAAAVVADTAVGDRILVKGSRSAGMERVLVALREDHDWREETPR